MELGGADSRIDVGETLQSPAERGDVIIGSRPVGRADMNEEAVTRGIDRDDRGPAARHGFIQLLLQLGEIGVEPVHFRRRLGEGDAEQLGAAAVGDDSVDVVPGRAEHAFAERHRLEIELVERIEAAAIVDRQRLTGLGQEQARQQQLLALARVGAVDDVEAGALALPIEEAERAALVGRSDADPNGAASVGIPAADAGVRADHRLRLAGRDVDLDHLGPESLVAEVDRLLQGEADPRRAVVGDPDDVVGPLGGVAPGERDHLRAVRADSERPPDVEILALELDRVADADDQPVVIDPAPPVHVALARADQLGLGLPEQRHDREEKGAADGDLARHVGAVGRELRPFHERQSGEIPGRPRRRASGGGGLRRKPRIRRQGRCGGQPKYLSSDHSDPPNPAPEGARGRRTAQAPGIGSVTDHPTGSADGSASLSWPASVGGLGRERMDHRKRGSAASTCVGSTVIFGADQFVTGVRGWSGPDVVLTGSSVEDGGTVALLYVGPLAPTDEGAIHLLPPEFEGQDVTSSTFYGPATFLFNPSLGEGNVRAVGSYQYSASAADNHGMLYQGPPAGGGGWTQIDVPSEAVGGAAVWNTIPHSTMGDLVVGDYDLQGEPASANAFVYNFARNRWTIFDFEGCSLTTAYGIWQEAPGSSRYTIVGGTRDGHGIDRGFVVAYDSAKDAFSNLKLYSAMNRPGLLTHFQGITATATGFHLAGMTATCALLAAIQVEEDGSFSDAAWTAYTYPGSALTTGNTVYQDTLMGVFAVSGVKGVQSYAATFGG